MNPAELLKLKVRLLTEGVTVPEGKLVGRKGGAGPVGARYFLLPNNRPVGIPIRSQDAALRFNSSELKPTSDPHIWLFDQTIELRLIPHPRFYDLKTEEGIPYYQIALLHGKETLATTAYQSCKYWADGQQCQFCTIPISHRIGDTVLEKQPRDVAEVAEAGIEEGVVKDILITTGTPEGTDMGIERLTRIIEAIREFSQIPIGVQFEPPVELEFIEEIAQAGANAVGIHIESADEDIRKKCCPGKYQYGSLNLYRRAWSFALKYFGIGNVSTFILHGLGEDPSATLALTKELASSGILPVIAPVRPAPGSQLADFTPSYVGNLEDAITFYIRVGEILLKNDLNPSLTIAGCHRCGGCTPCQEAYDWALWNEHRK